MRIAAFSVILLASVTALDLPAEPVVVEDPEVRMVSNAGSLRTWCRVEGDYDACTFFVGSRLEGGCESMGQAWHLRPRVSFRPWIVLKNLRSLAHEHQHIREITRSARRHIASIERLGFESRDQCEQRLMSEREGFPLKMAAFARRSNESMHGRGSASGRRVPQIALGVTARP